MGLALCKNDNCVHKDKCLRYLTKDEITCCVMNFQAICTEDNDYKFLWKTEENKLENVDSNTENTEDKINETNEN